jgi:hypothetical protein
MFNAATSGHPGNNNNNNNENNNCESLMKKNDVEETDINAKRQSDKFI